MHSPSLITPAVAADRADSRARAAQAHRRARRDQGGGVLFGRFRRRGAAPPPRVARGRPLPPLAR